MTLARNSRLLFRFVRAKRVRICAVCRRASPPAAVAQFRVAGKYVSPRSASTRFGDLIAREGL